MQVDVKAELLAAIPQSFTDKEGVEVSYIKYVFLPETGDDVLLINSKQDFTEEVRQSGRLVVDMQDGKKARLVSFHTKRSADQKVEK